MAAVSVGVVNETPVLDLCYEEDSQAKVDMNIVMTDKKEFVEVQGTGEDAPFSKRELMELLELGEKGNEILIQLQREALGEAAQYIGQTAEKEVSENGQQNT